MTVQLTTTAEQITSDICEYVYHPGFFDRVEQASEQVCDALFATAAFAGATAVFEAGSTAINHVVERGIPWQEAIEMELRDVGASTVEMNEFLSRTPRAERMGPGEIVAHLEHKAVFPQKEAQIKHMFGKREEHIPNTLANRKLILDTVCEENFLLTDIHGLKCYAKILEDGSQVWVRVLNGEIRNCGINKIPIQCNALTGLMRPNKPIFKETK